MCVGNWTGSGICDMESMSAESDIQLAAAAENFRSNTYSRRPCLDPFLSTAIDNSKPHCPHALESGPKTIAHESSHTNMNPRATSG